MSLHDVSKSDTMRGKPTPNASDSVRERMAHGTTQFHNSGEEATSDGLKINERQIIAKQDQLNKAVYGFLPDGRFGLKVAKDGYDVLTAADDELIFNSEQNVFKIVGTGSLAATLPPATGFSSTPVAHGLGYAPIVIGFILVAGSTYLPTPLLQFDPSSGICIEQTRVEVDATNVYLKMYAPTAGSSYPAGFSRQVKYYLLQESAA